MMPKFFLILGIIQRNPIRELPTTCEVCPIFGLQQLEAHNYDECYRTVKQPLFQ